MTESDVTHIVFHAKPDCAANAKQIKQLTAAGHTVEVLDLTAVAWTPETLAPFFGDRPVNTWLNKLHPAVRAGDIDPAALTAEAALEAMIADPTLIRRPLMQVGEDRRFGFDPVALDAWIGLKPVGDGMSCDDKHAQGRCDHGHHHFPKAG